MEFRARASRATSPPRTLQEEILSGQPLTERELEVLVGLADGETAKESARRLFLAPITVKGYRKSLIAKLAARNGPHAVKIGIHRGLID